ncbi:MAG: hypothetical protein K6G00_08725 [Treponema sp.]|nr:hypothetical protein [Treponema sp.]
MQNEETLDIIEKKFIIHEISADEAKNQLIMQIYNNPQYFGLEKLNKDDLHSFLLWVQQRIVKLLTNYNSKIGHFATYFRQSIFLCKRSFLKVLARTQACEKSLIEISPLKEEEREYQYNSEEYSLSCCMPDNQPDATHIRYKDFMNALLSQKGIRWSQLEMKENLRKAACLILTLKACCFVDSDIIRKVSFITKLTENDITELLEQVKEKVGEKIKKRECCIKSRDSAFFFHRRYLLEFQKLQDDNFFSEKLRKKYEKQTKIWENRNKQLKTSKYMAIPSNAALAEVLNISDRKIGHIINSAKKNIDTISMKDYDISHETISCNRQRKQKKRDETNS